MLHVVTVVLEYLILEYLDLVLSFFLLIWATPHPPLPCVYYYILYQAEDGTS